MENNQDFSKIIKDFCNDLTNTFPEYEEKIKVVSNSDLEELQTFVKQKYPERFFDIIYENEDIFKDDSNYNVKFLPGLDFKKLWNVDGLSDNSKKVIWKYLQLLLFTCVGSLDSESSFGDTSKLFEAINENDFKDKLEETMKNIQNVFQENDISGNAEFDVSSNMPNPDDIHSHISSMMDGKIGRLAKEIAEETAQELDLGDQNNPDFFKTFLKNPNKIMNLVKSIGSKLDAKIKSGEIKESELMSEASDMLKNMKNMPGMKDINKMFGSMGMPNMGGKKGKMNMGAMQSQLNQRMKIAQTKERMQEKLKQRQAERELQELAQKQREAEYKEVSIDELLASLEEIKPGSTKTQNNNNNNNNNNNKKKKKKGKNKK